MADKRLSITHDSFAVRVVGEKDFALFPRVQRFNIDYRQNSNDIDELGNVKKAGTSKRPATITASIDTFHPSIQNISVIAGVDPAAFPVSGLLITEVRDVDIIGLVKDPKLAEVAKSVYIKKATVSEINYRFSVDGEAEENFSFNGVRRIWFKNGVTTEKFTTGTNTFTLSDTPVTLKDGTHLISVVLDGVRLKETSSPTPQSGEYYYNSGTNQVVTGDNRTEQLIVSYQTSSSSTSWLNVEDTTIPVTSPGSDNKIIIAANEIPRVQSIDIRVAFNLEEVKELGNREIAGNTIKPPTVEGSLTVLDTDTELIELFTVGSIGGSDTEFEPGKGCSTSGIDLKVRIYDPCDENQSTVLKTIYVPNIELDGDSYTMNVGNTAQQVFNFKGTTVYVYSGLY